MARKVYRSPSSLSCSSVGSEVKALTNQGSECFADYKAATGDQTSRTDGFPQDMERHLPMARRIKITDDRLHALAYSHEQHRDLDGITTDDPEGSDSVISSVVFQIAVHNDIHHTCGDVHDKSGHTDSDDGN